MSTSDQMAERGLYLFLCQFPEFERELLLKGSHYKQLGEKPRTASASFHAPLSMELFFKDA